MIHAFHTGTLNDINHYHITKSNPSIPIGHAIIWSFIWVMSFTHGCIFCASGCVSGQFQEIVCNKYCIDTHQILLNVWPALVQIQICVMNKWTCILTDACMFITMSRLFRGTILECKIRLHKPDPGSGSRGVRAAPYVDDLKVAQD